MVGCTWTTMKLKGEWLKWRLWMFLLASFVYTIRDPCAMITLELLCDPSQIFRNSVGHVASTWQHPEECPTSAAHVFEGACTVQPKCPWDWYRSSDLDILMISAHLLCTECCKAKYEPLLKASLIGPESIWGWMSFRVLHKSYLANALSKVKLG